MSQLVVSKNGKMLIYEVDGIKVEVDCSKHHSSRHLDAIVEDLNAFFAYKLFSTTHARQYLNIIMETQKTKMPYTLITFIKDLNDVIKQYIREHGYKQEEKAKTDLFVTQEEIDQLLVISLRTKLLLPFLVLVDNTDEVLKEIAQDSNIGPKLFRLITNRLVPFKHNDTAAWNFLKISMFDNIEVYALVLLAFIQKKVLLICSIKRNPIVFILSIASDCIRWMSHTTSMYSEALDEGLVYTIHEAKFLSVLSVMKQQIIEWLGVEVLDTLEKNKIVGPLQRIWCYIMKPYVHTNKFSPVNAAIISTFTAYALLKNSDKLVSCNHLLKTSMWIPHAKLQSGHIDERKLLSRNIQMYGIDVKPFIYDELLIVKNNNYMYIDPLTKKKKIASWKILESELLNFFELYCSGVLKMEVERCVLPYLKAK